MSSKCIHASQTVDSDANKGVVRKVTEIEGS
jgi:hypothetical protein